MRVRERVAVLDDARLAEALTPRVGFIDETQIEPGIFTATNGTPYRRTVRVEAQTDGTHRVTQRVEVEFKIPYWGFLFGPLFTLHVARIGGPDDKRPVWFPPEGLDDKAMATLARLGVISLILGYVGVILTQTITYAAGEFGANKAAQGVTLAAVRLDVVLALPLALLADRRGRRFLVVNGAAAACALSALGALAPNLWSLAGAQVITRGFSSACVVALGVMVAEEMPSGGRAWATSLMAMAGFFGAGICIVGLPLADLADNAWRVLFLLPLLFAPVALRVGRGLTETHRFVAHVAARLERVKWWGVLMTHRGRFALMATSAFLIAVFSTPASQFQNEFLRTERGFSGAQITLFVTLTSIPGAIGIVAGGALAERGRRLVGAVAVFVGVGATVGMYFSSAWGLYAWSTFGSVVGAAAVPALGVYGAELFPTEARSAANGGIGFAGRVGSVIGLVIAGTLGDRIGLPRTFLYLSIGPALLCLLILVAYPETAHRELEDLNPEDAPL
ncbi:MAG: MFS transporter [Acidimicrobiales bacterium]|nr:MFS transporter [Acidimicrobiales bacterium]